MFNVFRIAADVVHCLSIYLLLKQIHSSQSVAGLSVKTQLLYLIVYATRYTDLFIARKQYLWNLVLKIVYLSTGAYVLWLMIHKHRTTRSPANIDTFKVRYLFLFAIVMAAVFHPKLTLTELLWSFSIWLESVAILPQLFMIQRTGKAETMTAHYVMALGVYRLLYLINWVYRWAVRDPPDYISVAGGLLQTALYSDFFYVYYTKVYQGKEFTLPQ